MQHKPKSSTYTIAAEAALMSRRSGILRTASLNARAKKDMSYRAPATRKPGRISSTWLLGLPG